jgi:hypothetical protein
MWINIQLRRSLEIDKSFSFDDGCSVHSVAMVLDVSRHNLCKRVNFSSLFLVLPLGSSRANFYALVARLSKLRAE